MAAMKLYYGSDLVGGEVDLDDFDELKTDVDGKYDKGDEKAIPDGKRDYADAAAMESAVKGNSTEIASIREEVADVLGQLGSENIQVEFGKYFPKYGKDDDDQEALIYDSAAEMGVVVQRNEQAIIDNAKAITDGDAATLQDAKAYADTQDATSLQAAKTYADTKDAETLAAANKHSDDNDVVTLDDAKDYTDEKIAAIPGVEGLEEFEQTVEELDKTAVRNANAKIGNPGDFLGGVIQIATVGVLPDTPDPNTLYIVKV